MVSIFASLGGFAALAAADFVQISRPLPAARTLPSIMRVSGYALCAGALALLAFAPSGLWPFALGGSAGVSPLPTLAALLAAGLAAGLLWSVFGELALAGRRNPAKRGGAVASGSYSLCRHPGFWWYAALATLLALSRSAARGSGPGGAQAAVRGFGILDAAIPIAADFLLILYQDRIVFPKLIPGYDDYKKSVPFLVPFRRRSASDSTGKST